MHERTRDKMQFIVACLNLIIMVDDFVAEIGDLFQRGPHIGIELLLVILFIVSFFV